MSKIQNAFAAGKALVVFVTCGDPDIETTVAAVQAAVDNGADLIELGIPFSDPTAEEPAVQAANIRALAGGMTTDAVFELARRLRRETQVPLVFATYANVVFSYGTERFVSTCGEIGVDGLVLFDLPYEEKEEFQPLCRQHDLAFISQIASNSGGRSAKIAENSEGFINLTARLQSNGQVDCPANIFGAIRANTDVPCVVDAGIFTPEQAENAAAVADGVVVKEAIVGLLEAYGKEAPQKIGMLVNQLKNAMK